MISIELTWKAEAVLVLFRCGLSNNQAERTETQTALYLPFREFQSGSLAPLDLHEMITCTLAVLAAARSSILLHGLFKVEGLCVCGITSYKVARLGNSQAITYFSRPACKYVDRCLRADTFLLLAVLLAELAMGVPIYILPQDYASAVPGPRFVI